MTEKEWLVRFSKKLRDTMEEKGCTQAELAKTSRISQSTVSAYLRASKLPGVRAILNISYALDIPVDELTDLGGRIE